MFIETTSSIPAPEYSVLDLLHKGDFDEAQTQLHRMGDKCLADPGNYALMTAYFDLCACASRYAVLSHIKPIDLPAPETLRSVPAFGGCPDVD